MPSERWIGSGLRVIGSLIILWFIWHHAHWSVALGMTLILVESEIVAGWMGYVQGCLKEITQILKGRTR